LSSAPHPTGGAHSAPTDPLAGMPSPYPTFSWPTQSQICANANARPLVKLYDVAYYCGLRMWVKGHPRSFKLVSIENLVKFPKSYSIVTMAVSLAISVTLSVKEWPDLDMGMGLFKVIE